MKIASEFAKKKIMITGAAGFIGQHLAATLAQVDCTLALVDRTEPRCVYPDQLANIHGLEADVSAQKFRDEVVDGDFDYVFHLAGNANVAVSVQQPALDFAHNCLATFELLDALRVANSKAELIYASSAAVYGNPAKLPICETDQTVPISPYGVSKLSAERYLSVYSRLYGVRGVSARMFSPFGPGLRKQIVYDLTCKVLKSSGVLNVLGDGRQARDFIYATDVISALLYIARRGVMDGSIYNVGTGVSTCTGDIAEEIVRIVGRDIRIEYEREEVAGYPEVWESDISKIRALGWAPNVPLSTGLELTVRSIEREYS